MPTTLAARRKGYFTKPVEEVANGLRLNSRIFITEEKRFEKLLGFADWQSSTDC